MTFLIYRTDRHRGLVRLGPTGQTFHLPHLLQLAWNEQGKPLGGWDVSANDMIRIHCGNPSCYFTTRLLSDFHPSSKTRIGVIELLHIYAFTWGEQDNPEWTPFMVRGRDVFYRDDYDNLTQTDRQTMLDDLPEYDPDGLNFAEFLYCRVNKNGTWVWGPTGMTNAAFLHGEALRFFQKVFLEVSCEPLAKPTVI